MFCRLKELRSENHLLQSDVAKVLNISKNTYEKYEVGGKTITIKHLNTLSNYYNVSLDYLTNISNIKNSFNFRKLKDFDIKQISNNIKYIRIYFNISQKELAFNIKISKTAISDFENSKRIPNVLVALAISKKYGISIDWLYGKSNKINIQK